MADDTATVGDLRRLVQRFVDERDWRRFHTPKNLAMSIAIEAAELMELVQWVNSAEARERLAREPDRGRLEEELADVCCYVLSLANALEVDLSAAVTSKLRKNAEKYPADRYRGRFEIDESETSQPRGDTP